MAQDHAAGVESAIDQVENLVETLVESGGEIGSAYLYRGSARLLDDDLDGAEADFKKALEAEEREVRNMCLEILRVKPDVVITEKGLSDYAQHVLMKENNVSCIRRIRKTDNNRVARVCGATIVHRPEEI